MGLTIVRLRVRGWKCFRAETVLHLQPKAYAIFASKDGSARDSNWAGKSSLQEAVDFALYGRLPEEFRARKKAWVSRGERGGEVEVELSDGSRIVRTQSAAGSEKLWCFPPLGEPAYQEAAQRRIEELVGFTAADFEVTRYFPQGRMAELVTLEPSARMRIVAGWLQLWRVQECEADAQEALRELAKQRDAKLTEASSLAASATCDFDLVEGSIDKTIEHAERELAAALERVGRAREAHASDRERARAVEDAQAFERVVEEGKRAREVVGASKAEAGEKLEGLRNVLAFAEGEDRKLRELAAAAGSEVHGKRRVHFGQFDGECPLVGRPCPAKGFVDGEAVGLAQELADATARLQGLEKQAEEASVRRAGAQKELRDYEWACKRVRELRERARALKPGYDRWRSLSGTTATNAEEELGAAETELAVCQGAVSLAKASKGRMERAALKAGEARAEAERLARAVRVASLGVALFGKNGAQRRLAEDALSQIEGEACQMMAEAGVPLTVEVRWSREGSGVAQTCGACGEPFPRSEKVKACARCGGERGANVVNKLEIVPSAQSGGARDLCGIFVQLAAAAWLAEERGAAFACAMLDEPLAALDESMRRAVSAHLTRVLARTGVEQALVIGHDRGALDALPGRILVESVGGWSTARVVA